MTSSSSHLFVIRDEPADWTDLVLRTWLSERNTTMSTSTTPAGEPRTLQHVEPGATPSTPTGVKKHYKGAKEAVARKKAPKKTEKEKTTVQKSSLPQKSEEKDPQ
uniref:Uncharacterized protein n=1 Tax=Branchiostoma floridae TaxID=7739 RepID=C3Z193_BRAFL|eukprot:XP_002597780.1 hypothetical protein BRAFLDRAFT_77317 [Branchiostoma floridae]